jgi:hypothetical protein
MRDRAGGAARLYVHLAHEIEGTTDQLNTLFEVEFGAEEAAMQWKAVGSIFQLCYWRPAWIIQEIAIGS